MSRISKWKLEKTKVKVVFRLQFHVTHIQQSGWDKLFISFIPADTGKPTAKTTKANVRNGSCKWGDPIYETTRLLQDSKTKLYDEKLYKLIVAMGSSRSSVLGEATINLADYVDASKPIVTTFPLQGCNTGTILHITVQLLTSKTGFREFEQQRELREKGLQSSEGLTNDQTDKVRTKFKADANELSLLEEEAIDGSSNTSGSLYAEKHETSSTNEPDSIKYELSHIQSPRSSKEEISNHQNIAHGSTGSIHEWSSNNSIDNELATENNRLRGSLEFAESSLFNLKLEVSSLQGVADELGAETHKLSDELVAEISSAQELAKEVLLMKSECLKLKEDIVDLKDSKLSSRIPLMEARNMQLQPSDGISVIEGKIRELQNKMYGASLEGDTKFIHLELEALLNFLLDFKLGSDEKVGSESADSKIRELSQFESGNGFDLDLCPPESILHHFSSNPPVSDAVNPMDAMKAQIFDLVRELDEAKVEKEFLTRKMYQMECYYEALIHELEENPKRLVEELQLLRNEHTTCLYALTVSKTEAESLREETNQQMLQFAEERRDLEAINEELERRASTSEAALRRARLNYSIAVDKLQKDLELLSSQVSSMFEANEILIKQALVKNPEEDDPAKPTRFQNQNLGLRKRSGGGDVLLEDLKRSLSMQEDLYRKVEEELVEMHSINLNLDVYSKALELSFCEVMKSSAASQNHLMLQLQKATDEIHALDEFKSCSISQCSEMALKNQLLEDKLMSVAKENYLLSEKLIDWESALSELTSCESKYAACLAANAELSLQLEHEAFENEKLRAESDELVSSKKNLEESFEFVQDKLANLLLAYGSQSLGLDLKEAVMQLEQLQHSVSMENIRLVEEKQNLKIEKRCADVALSSVRSEILSMKEKFKSGMLTKLKVSNSLVERLQVGIESVANKIQLSCEFEEKYVEKNEVLLADLALFEDEMQILISRNGGLAREISNLDSLAEELGRSKLEITELMREKQEADVRLVEKSEECMKLSHEVNSLKEDSRTLHDELHAGKGLRDELEREVEDLTLCLSKDREELLRLERERAELEQKVQDLALSSSKDLERRLELEAEKAELERKLQDQEKWIEIEQQNAELERKIQHLTLCSSKDKQTQLELEQRASHLELEKSRLAHLLHEKSELVEELEKNTSSQASFESQLSDMHEYWLASDVKLVHISNEYETVLHKLASSEMDLQNTESMLNRSLEGEANWRREKENLLANLDSLRSELQVSKAQNKLLSESNNAMRDGLEASKRELSTMEEEMSNLIISKDEMEVLVIVLKAKVNEQTSHIALLQGYKEELAKLGSQLDQVSDKLSEQVEKTEEFKNLSIHLKELKDKAESECVAIRERRENEVPSATMQDSLRVAFIKEQYETKNQELKQQLSMSKKHGEEMLMKLQDAIDEIESRKKSEAVSLKKNEELSTRLSALEAELLSVISEKREKSNGYDRTKAELECALLSLECCKEEKEKLRASLLQWEAEKSNLVDELTSIKGQLEELKCGTNLAKGENFVSVLDTDGESADSMEPVLLQTFQEAALHVKSNEKTWDANDENSGAQRLRSSIEHLHEELEKMKNENAIGDDANPDFEDTQKEIMQLCKANEELRSMFPLFDEISSGGNALERVLALEIELAEALKTKNRSNTLFQSSFLKQHCDEEAIFKSFRDINELMREMLELKGRHAGVEAELREMHDRYSRLSLQFAEVEGERQKLKMTLKNARSINRLAPLNRSSSDNVMDHHQPS